MAVAKVYTVMFVVVVLASELLPGPFFGPAPTWTDKFLMLLPGLVLLAIGWAWLIHIRRGVERP
jgi:hypothetical protein